MIPFSGLFAHEVVTHAVQLCYRTTAESMQGYAQVPSTFSFLGIRNETAGAVHNVHTPRFVMDEAQMPLGTCHMSTQCITHHRICCSFVVAQYQHASEEVPLAAARGMAFVSMRCSRVNIRRVVRTALHHPTQQVL